VGQSCPNEHPCAFGDLPPNDEFHDLATDLAMPPPAFPMPEELTVEARAQLLRAGMLGLATHTIPQIRQFLPTSNRVTAARLVQPFGYQVVLTSDDRTAELIALMPGNWGLTGPSTSGEPTASCTSTSRPPMCWPDQQRSP
jgi:hypothetical protein